jgi:hypothetical protein
MNQNMTPFINRQYNYFWQPFFIILCILVIIVAALCIYTYSQNCSLAGNKDQWKAVFISNNQTYFGKIVSETAKTLVLRDVYYLQPAPQSSDQVKKAPTPQPQYNLLRLQDAIYKPISEMRINREQILFIESLQADSGVIKTIQRLSAIKK